MMEPHGYFPEDTGRKLSVCKTFRRRPRRLLNFLCTFNLRPVSTGLVDKTLMHLSHNMAFNNDDIAQNNSHLEYEDPPENAVILDKNPVLLQNFSLPLLVSDGDLNK